MDRIIYLDNAATTQVSETVLNEMLPFFRQTYSNPSAIYSFAGEGKKAVDNARKQAAELIGAKPEEIYFTGGGSESDNSVRLNITQFCTLVPIWKNWAVKLHILTWTRMEKFLLTS